MRFCLVAPLAPIGPWHTAGHAPLATNMLRFESTNAFALFVQHRRGEAPLERWRERRKNTPHGTRLTHVYDDKGGGGDLGAGWAPNRHINSQLFSTEKTPEVNGRRQRVCSLNAKP